jgi:hypothetical protein
MIIDPLGLCTEYNSGTLLRTIVPGQIAWDNAMTSFNQGDYASAGLSTVEMLGEQVLTVLTLGESQAIAQSSKQATDAAFKYAFGKGGLLNSNRYLRLGVGRKGGEKVFRASGQWINKISKSGHIDLFKMGKL